MTEQQIDIFGLSAMFFARLDESKRLGLMGLEVQKLNLVKVPSIPVPNIGTSFSFAVLNNLHVRIHIQVTYVLTIMTQKNLNCLF